MVMVPAFLFVFSIVVVFHELGHFLAARALGVRVDRFSLGFGPPLAVIRDKHGTDWTLGAIPLGGYVKFFGDASAASTPDTDRLTALRNQIQSEHGREAVGSCFHFKPVWQRAIIVAAGPLANVVLALVIFSLAAGIMGESGLPPVIGAVTPDSPAAAAGLQKGDRILTVNGRPIRYYEELRQHAVLASGDHMKISVDRRGEIVSLDLTVGRHVINDEFGGQSEVGYIGVLQGLPPILGEPEKKSAAAAAGFRAGDVVLAVDGKPVEYDADYLKYVPEYQNFVDSAGPGPVRFTVQRGEQRLEIDAPLSPTKIDGGKTVNTVAGLTNDPSSVRIDRKFGPLGALARGAQWTWESASAPVIYIARTLTGRESGRELGGVLRIMKVAGATADQAMAAAADDGPLAGLANAIIRLVMLAGALSVAIGLVNVLPIPILDGGHLLYYAYEAVVGRPLGEGAQEWGFRIGLALVFGLMIFAAWNDLRYLRVFEAIGNILS
jgi:regulator of sigma E protease